MKFQNAMSTDTAVSPSVRVAAVMLVNVRDPTSYHLRHPPQLFSFQPQQTSRMPKYLARNQTTYRRRGTPGSEGRASMGPSNVGTTSVVPEDTGASSRRMSARSTSRVVECSTNNSEAAGASLQDADRTELLAIIDRQRRQLHLKKNAAGRMRDALKDLKEKMSEVEEELEEKELIIEALAKNELQYRNWWLNEIQFTKLLLNKVPNPNRDIDLVRESQAHYLGHY
ncbi:hypothetical protein BKA70DRAFT_1222227 [Coprinopsis sp. MPI-PUGE-AT-0042]|nr:hypothetical protein BKA70DRAFT_1222227 [Coprinopsis sp. MPI-PUGE-AT-0042]